MPVPLDEFPLHQVPLSLEHVASTDRNAYDRSYFNAHDRTGELFLITGFGVYPNLGVKDAFALVRRGDQQSAVHFSDRIDDDRLNQRVGAYRIEVIEPLRRLRLICDDASLGLTFDLTWEGSFDPIDEQHHTMRRDRKAILDACRFAQVGTWEGSLAIDGHDYAVDRPTWVGTRDRSWGIRPVGEAEPPGKPLTLEVDTLLSAPTHVGGGYGGDPDWTHGQWKGADLSERVTYDLTDPEVAGRIPFGVVDHVARASCDGAEGWGLFEHGSIGRHDPSGFADLGSVAP